MTAAAGSGEAGQTLGRRFRRIISISALVGFLLVILGSAWPMWGFTGGTSKPVTAPGWYVAPAILVSEDSQQKVARGTCYIAGWFNSDLAPDSCQQGYVNQSGLSCYASVKFAWCSNPPIPTATLCWLLSAVALVVLSNLTMVRTARVLSAEERFGRWRQVFMNALVGAAMLFQADQAVDLHLRDLIIRGCESQAGPCELDFSGKVSLFLMFGMVGLLSLSRVLPDAFRSRHDFFYRPDAVPEEQK
jgi:hypothetical protein